VLMMLGMLGFMIVYFRAARRTEASA
jgi:hypothetical protein